MAIEPISNRERGLSVRTKLNAAIREANKVEKKADLQALLDHINNSNNPHNIQPENIGAEREGVAFDLLLQHANSPGNVHGVPSGEAVEWKSSAQGKADTAQANAKAYTDTELSGHIAASDPHTQYQLKSDKGQANGYAGLDGNAKVPESLLPAIAITEVLPVADIAARDALTVQIGDVAVVADASDDPSVEAGAASYIYDGDAWLQLRNPDFPVVSVNGQVGAVSLSASDVNADEAGTAVQVVGTHSTKSGDVHGVPVGESVEWQAGAQAKATEALTSANAYTDAHANKTGDTHGVPAGQLIEWKASAQAKADAALTSANAYTDTHEQRQDNPHGVTATQVGADAAGTAQNVMDNHLSAANPHSQYVTSAEAGGAAPVQSVHGRTGNVMGQTGDYTYDQVGADQSGAAAQALVDAKSYTDAGLSGKLGTNAKAADSDKLDGKHVSEFATSAQGAKADSSVQPSDLASVATSGAYSDLSGRPTLGSAAYESASAFASASHGHAWSDLSSVPATASRWPTFSEVTSKPSAYPPSSHDHDERYTSWNGVPVGGMKCFDTRDFAGASSSYVPAPADIPNNRAVSLFSRGFEGHSWRSALVIMGWSSTYAAWAISGPSSTSTDEDYYLRSGAGDDWGVDRKIYHSGNFDPADKADKTYVDAQIGDINTILDAINGEPA